jgi:hypothetical protein
MRILFILLSALMFPFSAAATTITSISMTLEWNGTIISDIDVMSYETGDRVAQGNITLEEDIWGFPHALRDVDLTQPVHFKAVFDDTPAIIGDASLRSCDFAGLNCNLKVGHNDGGGVSLSTDRFYIGVEGFFDDIRHFEISGGLSAGDSIRFLEWTNGGFPYFSPEKGILSFYGDVGSSFTVLSSDVSIVVQPLPSSLMLLPAGLGALAFLRHRRRKTA